MRLSSPCWAVTSVDWSCLKLLFYFSFCNYVVGTALEACEPLSCSSVIPVTITEKIKYQCSESLLYLLLTVPSCFVEADCFTVHRSSFQRWWWERGHSPAAQLQIVQSLEPHLWLELFAPSKALYLGWPISSGTVPMQGPGLTVVFWTAGFVSCGLSRGSACVTPWLSYSPAIQFELSTFGL